MTGKSPSNVVLLVFLTPFPTRVNGETFMNSNYFHPLGRFVNTMGNRQFISDKGWTYIRGGPGEEVNVIVENLPDGQYDTFLTEEGDEMFGEYYGGQYGAGRSLSVNLPTYPTRHSGYAEPLIRYASFNRTGTPVITLTSDQHRDKWEINDEPNTSALTNYIGPGQSESENLLYVDSTFHH